MCTDDVTKEGESLNQTRRGANACATSFAQRNELDDATRRDGGFGGGEKRNERLTMRMFLFVSRRSDSADAMATDSRRSSGLMGSAMKLFKSLSRTEKRSRTDEEMEAEDAVKRMKTTSSDGQLSGDVTPPPSRGVRNASGASFITSSVRKSTVRRTGTSEADRVAPTNLSSRFANDDSEDEPVAGTSGGMGSPVVKIKRTRSKKILDTIFSPMFSFFSSDDKSGRKVRKLKKSRLGGRSEHKADTVASYESEDDDFEPIALSQDAEALRSMQGAEELEGKLVELVAGTSMPAVEYVARFGMTSEEAASAPDEEYDEEFDPWAFIYNLKSHVPNTRDMKVRQALPPRASGDVKNTLVLDLDETLVHSNLENANDPYDFSFPVSFNDETHTVKVKKRPHLSTFMDAVSKQYEVIVFTASQRVYADKLLDILDPEGKWFKHRLFRDSCVQIDGNFMKDLRVLGRDLSRTIIIDNSPQAFGLQVENGIPIESWYDDEKDDHLLWLIPILTQLSKTNEVRTMLHRAFNLQERVRRGGLRSEMWRRLVGQTARI